MKVSLKNTQLKISQWLIQKGVGETASEEFIGDLQEMFDDRMLAKNYLSASFMLWIDTLHLMVGFTSFNVFKTRNNNVMMLRNMIKVAWRNAVRQKQFSILNVLGLTIGIATCILLGLYVLDESAYDEFHAKGDRIYRINQPLIWGDWDEKFASTGPNVAVALREDAPEFEELTRLLSLGTQTTRRYAPGKISEVRSEEAFFAAEDNFFNVFSFEFLSGDPLTALRDPMSVVLTEETAERYFGYKDAMEQIIQVRETDGTWKNYVVKGVLKNNPTQSHLQFDLLYSLSSYSKLMDKHEWKWIWTAFSTYGLVKPGVDIAALTENMQAVPPKWASATTERIFSQSFEEYTAGRPWTLYLQPLSDIYLSDIGPQYHRFGRTGNPLFVRIFGVIGILVLVLSCINFMNLSTARSSNRAKEVGIRKVLGSGRSALVQQFILESVLFVAMSTVLALVVVHFGLDPFNEVSDKAISLYAYLVDPMILISLGGFVVLLGGLAGSYPALYLSSFRPIATLKGKLSSGFRGKKVRNGLVVFQFTISIGLIICTFFVQKQLSYASSLDLGFSQDNILQIHNVEQLGSQGEVLLNKMKDISAFSVVGKSYSIPPDIWDGERYRSDDPSASIFDMSNFRADGDFMDVMNLDFIAGRNFDRDIESDKYGVVINATAAKAFGWSMTEAHGKTIVCTSDKGQKLEVIGVVNDFNYNSLRQELGSLVILHYKNDRSWNYNRGSSFLSARLAPELASDPRNLQKIIEEIKSEVQTLDASAFFEYSFMDKEYEEAFRSEQSMSQVLNIFTLMALIIACLGLFGLAAFSAEQRLKELGIRKVLGAKVSQLLFLFSSEFTKLILISILIACPLAYYMVDYWLEDFLYRTSIDVWVFIVAGLSACAIAVITVGYQSLKAAYKNPVDTLKDE